MIMKKINYIISCFLFFSVGLQAQVLINEDASVTGLVQQHIDENRTNYTISGWRIQLMATTDRRKVERGESKFIQNHPTISVKWEHAKPYYKLKAGAFATKLDATRVLKELKSDYPSALLVKSNVSISEILN